MTINQIVKLIADSNNELDDIIVSKQNDYNSSIDFYKEKMLESDDAFMRDIYKKEFIAARIEKEYWEKFLIPAIQQTVVSAINYFGSQRDLIANIQEDDEK